MNKNIFLSKNRNKTYITVIFTFILILLIYFISFYIFTNKKYFIIKNSSNNIYYIIPEDKEGEKVKFVNKKSINNSSIDKQKINNFKYFDSSGYTIQIYSDINYENIEIFANNLINRKSEIINNDQLFLIKLNSDIGTDYFLTYKNFNSKTEALSYCKKLSFIDKCLILNIQHQ